MADAKQNELILLYLYGELLPEEKIAFEKELSENKLLKEAYESEKELHELYSQRAETEVSDAVLFESRRRLRETLNTDFSDSSRSGAVNGGIIGFLFGNSPKLAGAIAMLIVGIVIGKAVTIDMDFSNGLLVKDFTADQSSDISVDLLGTKGLEIADLNIYEYDPKSGEITLTIDAVSSMGIKGNIKNPKIQKLLAAALQSDLGPSIRLKTVSLLRANRNEKKINEALIYALINDANPGVRLKAAETLTVAHLDRAIMEAFLQALSRDENNGVRMQAIQALTKFNDKEVTDMLKDKMVSDENEYIRFLLREHFSDNETEKTEREI